MQRIMVTVGFTCVLALTVAAAGQGANDGPRLAPEDFAILPWGGTPADKGALDDIRRCGFNLAGFVAPDGLDAVAAAGLKCIVGDGRMHAGDDTDAFDDAEINRRVRAVVDKVGKHPAVFGYYLRDEPKANMFPCLGRWAAAVKAAAPDARPYINLFPIYAAAGSQLGTATYEEYVESFVKIVKPAFVSYDNYSLMDDGSLRDGYFGNLEVARAVALRHGLPFWNIVLGNAHFRYAEPSETTLRFQVYTSLAYGARGISYFTYFTPKIGNYRLGAIDPFGDKTPTWDMLRRVNLQIHRLGPTYLKLKSVNVFHLPAPATTSQPALASRYLADLSGGGQFVVGEFDGPDARPYVLIVNKDLQKSTAFGVRFKSAGTIMLTNAYTGGEEPWSGENNWLAPGQGMLLSVKP